MAEKKFSYNLGGESFKDITIENVYSADKITEKDMALDQLARNEGRVWSTGLESVAGESATVPYESAFAAKHIASIRMYKTNSYIFLAPGEKVALKVRSSEEAFYYSQIANGTDILKVTTSGDANAYVTEVAPAADPAVVNDCPTPTEEENPSVDPATEEPAPTDEVTE